jgi:zinc protease
MLSALRTPSAIVSVFTPTMHFSKPEIPREQFVLSNGLTVVFHEDHRATLVALNIWYHGGWKNEKPCKPALRICSRHLLAS